MVPAKPWQVFSSTFLDRIYKINGIKTRSQRYLNGKSKENPVHPVNPVQKDAIAERL
jgi:hypothetical protein